MSAWLRAGLIGAIIIIVLNLIGLIPLIACLTFPLTLLAYGGIGALAASYMPPQRQAGPAAGQGALAAGVAALAGGVVGMITGIVRTSLGGTNQFLSQIPPESLEALRDVGIQPEMFFSIGGATIAGTICCGIGIFFAAALGAVGAAIYASARPQ